MVTQTACVTRTALGSLIAPPGHAQTQLNPHCRQKLILGEAVLGVNEKTDPSASIHS